MSVQHPKKTKFAGFEGITSALKKRKDKNVNESEDQRPSSESIKRRSKSQTFDSATIVSPKMDTKEYKRQQSVMLQDNSKGRLKRRSLDERVKILQNSDNPYTVQSSPAIALSNPVNSSNSNNTNNNTNNNLSPAPSSSAGDNPCTNESTTNINTPTSTTTSATISTTTSTTIPTTISTTTSATTSTISSTSSSNSVVIIATDTTVPLSPTSTNTSTSDQISPEDQSSVRVSKIGTRGNLKLGITGSEPNLTPLKKSLARNSDSDNSPKGFPSLNLNSLRSPSTDEGDSWIRGVSPRGQTAPVIAAHADWFVEGFSPHPVQHTASNSFSGSNTSKSSTPIHSSSAGRLSSSLHQSHVTPSLINSCINNPISFLERPTDLYTEKFGKNCAHLNFMYLRKGKAIGIISIERSPYSLFPNMATHLSLGPCFRALLTTKEGYEEFSMYNVHVHACGADPTSDFEQFLKARVTNKEDSFYAIHKSGFPHDMEQLEQKHSFKVANMKIAVLYITKGQTDIKEIFANKPPKDGRFWKFMKNIAEEIDLKTWPGWRGDFGKSGTDVNNPTYYTKWENFEIMFHLAPYMDPEQHRRLVGNDIGVLIFYDCPDPATSFVPFKGGDIGVVPHVFAVVQPHPNNNDQYRVGFFHRPNVPAHLPVAPPPNKYMDIQTLKPYLFTKLHNGYAKSRMCPPMRNLFVIPRAAAIQELADKYPKLTQVQIQDLKKTEKTTLKNQAEKSQNKSILRVHVHSGSNLASKDDNGLSDPFVVVEMAHHREKTSVKWKTLDPEWKETLCFDITDLDPCITTVTILCLDRDKGTMTDDYDYMGEFVCLLSQLPTTNFINNNDEHDETTLHTFTLNSVNGDHVSGSLKLGFSFETQVIDKDGSGTSSGLTPLKDAANFIVSLNPPALFETPAQKISQFIGLEPSNSTDTTNTTHE